MLGLVIGGKYQLLPRRTATSDFCPPTDEWLGWVVLEQSCVNSVLSGNYAMTHPCVCDWIKSLDIQPTNPACHGLTTMSHCILVLMTFSCWSHVKQPLTRSFIFAMSTDVNRYCRRSPVDWTTLPPTPTLPQHATSTWPLLRLSNKLSLKDNWHQF